MEVTSRNGTAYLKTNTRTRFWVYIYARQNKGTLDMAKRIRFERGQELQERARTVAAICIQPHIRKRITPRQLLPLPWGNKKSEIRNNATQLTAEERKERFEKLSQKVK